MMAPDSNTLCGGDRFRSTNVGVRPLGFSFRYSVVFCSPPMMSTQTTSYES